MPVSIKTQIDYCNSIHRKTDIQLFIFAHNRAYQGRSSPHLCYLSLAQSEITRQQPYRATCKEMQLLICEILPNLLV